jgi:hypothetical protein
MRAGRSDTPVQTGDRQPPSSTTQANFRAKVTNFSTNPEKGAEVVEKRVDP